MVSLDWQTATAGPVTLVELLVTSDNATRIQVENCLDGPVWPPRRHDVPVEGWDGEGFEGVVEDRLVLGYASPATPSEPPARIASATPLSEETTSADEQSPTARELVRTLGEATPPRDVVGPAARDRGASTGCTRHARPRDGPDSPPPELTAWLDAVEARLDTAQRLATASSVSEATAAVEAVGGPADVTALRDRLANDQKELARLRDRCETLRQRAETVEIPAETLARLS